MNTISFILTLVSLLISSGMVCLGAAYLCRYIRWPLLFASQIRFGCLVIGTFLLLTLLNTYLLATHYLTYP